MLACVLIVPKGNKTQDKKIDTEIQPTAYLEGSHSSLGATIWPFTILHSFVESTENSVCLMGQKGSMGVELGRTCWLQPIDGSWGIHLFPYFVPFVFLRWVSPHRPGWHGTCYEHRAGLGLMEIFLSELPE